MYNRLCNIKYNITTEFGYYNSSLEFSRLGKLFGGLLDERTHCFFTITYTVCHIIYCCVIFL